MLTCRGNACFPHIILPIYTGIKFGHLQNTLTALKLLQSQFSCLLLGHIRTLFVRALSFSLWWRNKCWQKCEYISSSSHCQKRKKAMFQLCLVYCVTFLQVLCSFSLLLTAVHSVPWDQVCHTLKERYNIQSKPVQPQKTESCTHIYRIMYRS